MYIKKILISLICLFFTSYIFCQTESQRQQIRFVSNTTILQQLVIQYDSVYRKKKEDAIKWAINNGFMVKDTSPESGLSIMRLENGIPIYYINDNLNAAKTVSTDKVWIGGISGLNLDGTGIIIGQWECATAWTGHQELTGNVIAKDPWAEICCICLSMSGRNHGTHVAGTMIAKGIDLNAKGMASGAIIHTYSFDLDEIAEITAFADSGFLLSNHSYGIASGWKPNGACDWIWEGDIAIDSIEDYKFGFYSDVSKAYDTITNNAPYYLIVKSAGNFRGMGPDIGDTYLCNSIPVVSTHETNGGSDGFDCLSERAVAKNILAVGAVNDIPSGYSDTNDVIITSFSAWGPTDDGRIKPDLVANGTQVYSSSTNLPTGSAYTNMTGTSMAAPNVTGSLALLQQHHSNTHDSTFMFAATLKALVIHTADEAGAANGPDYKHGWGLLNTKKAADVITQDVTSCAKPIHELVLNQNDTFQLSFDFDTTQPFIKATIVWNDPAGTPIPPALDSMALMLVNDLDLRIIRQSDSLVFFPWTLDPLNPANPADTTQDNLRDNVEQVFISAPDTGAYIVKVTHKGTLLAGSQAFSLIITGADHNFYPQLTALMFTTDALCNGDSTGTALVTACGGTPPYTYLWSDGQTNDTATGLAAGIYQVTIIDILGDTTTDTAIINEPPFIAVTTTSTDALCNGASDGTATATPSGGQPGYAYLWNDPSAQTTSTATGLAAGTYDVIVTDALGCTVTDSATINEPSLLTVTTDTIIDALCNQAADFGIKTGSAKATASGGTPGYSYLWDDTLAQTTDSITDLPPGTYIVTVTDANGCTAVDTAIINEPDSITLTTSTTNALCDGVSDGTATVTATGGTLPYFILRWKTTPVQDSVTATGLAAGIYNVLVVDDNTCVTTLSGDTVFNDPLAFTVSVSTTDEICIGSANGTATAAVTGQTPPFTYLWDDPLLQTDSIADSLSTGVYTVIVTDSNGCIITATDTVNLLPQPVANAGTDTTICFGDTITIGALPVDTTLLFAWSPASGLNDTTISNPVALPDSSTEYILSVTDTATGCVVHDTVLIIVIPLPNADVGNDTIICSGDSIIIGPTTTSVTSSYNWSPVSGLNDPNIPNPIASPDNLTEYVLTVIDTVTTCTNSDTIFIDVITMDTTSYTVPDTSDSVQIWTPANHPFAPFKATIFIRDTLRIPAGWHITIQGMTFEFDIFGIVIIEPDATLTALNTTFTGLEPPCETPWVGIHVQAEVDSMDIQHFGRLILDSSSVIEHAQQGIFGKGIVEAQNSILRNNDVSYHVKRLTKLGFNPSFFKNCTFESTMPLRSGSTEPHKFVVIDPGVSSVLFENDTFRNTFSGFTGAQRPISIQAFDAQNITLNNNIFTDVSRGVFSINSLSTIESRFIITNNIFTDVAAPIRIEGGRFDLITGNEFHGFVIVPGRRSVFFGIYLLNTSGFIIKANIFDVVQYAIFCINSGDLGGEITYDNVFNDCWRDIDARGDNPLLSIKCNVHTDNIASAWTIVNYRFQDSFGNWVTIPADMKDHQGTCFPNNTRNPAGNDFNNGNSHIFIIRSARPTGSFTYHCHTPNFSFPNVVPFNSSAGVTIDTCPVGKNNLSCCPTFPFCPIPIDIDLPEKVPFDTLPAAEKRIMKEIKQAPNPAERQLKVNELMHFFLNRKEKAQAIAFLEKETTVAAKRLLAATYIKDKDTIKAALKLTQIPWNNLENEKFVKINTEILNMVKSNRELSQMNQAEEQCIRDAANTATPAASSQAQAILKIVFNESFNTYLPDPDSLNNGARFASPNELDVKKPVTEPVFFSIVPNPLVERGVVQYELDEKSDFIVLELYNISGKLLRSYMLYKYNDSFIINTAGLENGTYLLKITDKKVVKTLKMVILK